MTSIESIKKQEWTRGNLKKAGYRYRIFRFLSIYCSKPLLHTPITANQATFLCVFSSVLAAFFLALGENLYLLIAIFLLYLAELLDYVDGIIARCKKQETRLQFGFLHETYHLASFAFIFLGIGITAYRITNGSIFLYLGFSGTIFQLLIGFLFSTKELFIYKCPNAIKSKSVNKTSPPMRGVNKKIKKIGLNIFVVPMKYIRDITAIFIILHLLKFDVFKYYLIFYGIFLPIKCVIFFGWAFFTLKKIEK